MYEKLSYSDKILADAALSRPGFVVNKSIGELSEFLRIAPSTIVAATKKFGFNGFKDFKIALASEMINPTRSINETQIHIDNHDTILEKTVSNCIVGLNAILDNIHQESINIVAKQLIEAPRVFIIGIGTSGILAREMHDYLFRLGINCALPIDVHHQLLVSKRAAKDDVVVLISQSGMNKEIILIGEELLERECKVIGISNFQNTPFAKCTSILLAPFKTEHTYHENNYTLRLPIMCIIESIYYSISSLAKETYDQAVKENKKVIKQTSILSMQREIE